MRSRLVVADRVRTAAGLAGDALLIQDGKVAAVGSATDLRVPEIAEDRYPGGVIVPGLRDAHMHPLPYAVSLTRLTVKEATDFDDLLERVRAAAALLPPGAPLIGNRLDDETLAEAQLPNRFDLDRMVPDRPLLLYRYCGHIAVANTQALERAGVDPHTQDPAGGSMDRDEQGAVNGVLRETAIELVAGPLGGLSAGPQPEEVLKALRGLTTLGITSVGAIMALGGGPWCDTGNELQTVLSIARDLPLNLAVLVIAEDPEELERAADALSRAGPRLRFLGVKEFADGSLGGHTAALRLSYADRADTRGTLRLDPDATRRRARTALRLGGKVAVHAIGDLANARVLDLFDDLLTEGADPADLRVEHASLLTHEEIGRFAASGVTASVQPAFMASEYEWLEKRLGVDRLVQAYPFATLAAAGVPLAGGSDCPVEPPHPLSGIAVARDRAGLVPAERLSGEQALGIFTDGAARAIGEPVPLAVGSPADFVVLDGDPVELTPAELRTTSVLATWIDGESVAFPDEPVVWTG